MLICGVLEGFKVGGVGGRGVFWEVCGVCFSGFVFIVGRCKWLEILV